MSISVTTVSLLSAIPYGISLRFEGGTMRNLYFF
jgi:hypothetical protein